MTVSNTASLSERYRTHTCEGLRKEDVGNTIRLSGWVPPGPVTTGVFLFIDLRDHYGMTQVVADPRFARFQHRRSGARRMGYLHLR